MLTLNEIKTGVNIVVNGTPFLVLSHQHSKMGRAGSVLRTKLKNLITGTVMEKTFQGAESVLEANITKSKSQYTYKDGLTYNFMDSESYEQFALSKEVLGDNINYLKEGTEVTILNFNNIPINIEIPVKMKLKVVEAPPGIKGNSVSSGGKIVVLETGVNVSVPLFVKVGDEVIINTQEGKYVSRA